MYKFVDIKSLTVTIMCPLLFLSREQYFGEYDFSAAILVLHL